MAELLLHNSEINYTTGIDIPGCDYKHGSYLYNNKAFITKFDALDEALLIDDKNPKIRFYYHDKIYSKLTTEPDISLDQLYINRAKQLRDEYDHIILLYSGGSDSHEVLKVFTNNNIHLDEVQILHPRKMTENKLDFQQLMLEGDQIVEIDLIAIPELIKLSKTNPEIKIRIFDTTDNFLSIDDNYLSTYRTHFLNSFFPTQMVAVIIDKENHDLATKKKTCLVWGAQKPWIVLDSEDYFYYGFNDMVRPFSPFLNGPNKSPLHFENFFWSIDAPLITVKQSFAVMHQIQFDMNQNRYHSYNMLKNMDVNNLHIWMKSVIYQYWDYNKYQGIQDLKGWHLTDRNISRFYPNINHITEDKRVYYTNKYKNLGTLDFTKPSLGLFNTLKYRIGKLVKKQ